VCEKKDGYLVTFLAQGVKLVEERWEMHNDARADDARYGGIDQSCNEGVVDYLAVRRRNDSAPLGRRWNEKVVFTRSGPMGTMMV
jgi:hypothetical protein